MIFLADVTYLLELVRGKAIKIYDIKVGIFHSTDGNVVMVFGPS